MDEEYFGGPFGILFYIIMMLLFFSIPIIVGFVSGLIAIHFKRKLKTVVALWSVILFSPIFFILISSVLDNRPGFIGNTLVRQPTYGLIIASIPLPVVVPVWILGVLLLYSITKGARKNL
jgi:predicted neutral ceramidase superfamily lipid hydrolase